MGIPKFGKWWISNFNYSKIEKKPVDILCIDANGLLHQVAQYVYAYNEKSTIQDKEKVLENGPDKNIKIFTYNVINNIIKLANETNANHVLFFVDGPVCMAKMMQQRSRRYVAQKIMYNDQLLFNTSDISPGTPFMVKFDELFRISITKNLNRMRFKLTYSSYEEVGEGEHKFINYIRENKITLKRIGLVGLDADLFMLGSIIHTMNNYVTLLRFNIYIDISVVWNNLKFTQDNIYDFIYTFFLIGNDFVPKMIYFYELENNLTILWNTFYTFIKGKKSVRENFVDFLKSLKSQETNLFNNLYKFFVKNNVNEIESIMNITKVIKVYTTAPAFSENKMTLDYESFRKMLYSNVINVDKLMYASVNEYCTKNKLSIKKYKDEHYVKDESTITNTNIISSMISNFVNSLNWTYLYYTTGNVDYLWYSKINYAPLITDLINNYNNLNFLNFQSYEKIDEDDEFYRENPQYIDIETQLKIIMPPSYMKDIVTYGPFEIVKDTVFFSKEGFHNYVVNSPIYPVNIELRPYKLPRYINYNESYKPTVVVKEYSISFKQDKPIIDMPKQDVNNVFRECMDKLKSNIFSLNTDYLTDKIYNAKYITTQNNIQLVLENGFYLIKCVNKNCYIEYDDNEFELIKDKYHIIYIKEYIIFNTNDVKLTMIPLVKN